MSRDDVLLEITPHVLLKAYACGIFPMAESTDDPTLHWIEPEYRGIIPLEHFHVPRRLAKTIRSDYFTIRIDSHFSDVIRACAQTTPERTQTWINEPIYRLYNELYNMGYCHSVEAWLNDELVGGLYGVHLGSAFFGESMFSRHRDASKVALVHLVGHLKLGGFTLLDTQFVTDHLRRFGAIEIHREAYQKHLEEALPQSADFKDQSAVLSGSDILHAVNHTS